MRLGRKSDFRLSASTATPVVDRPFAHRESTMAFKTDIEIAREAKKKPILEIGAKLGIPAESLLPYGHGKAKVCGGCRAGGPSRRQADPGDRDQPDPLRARARPRRRSASATV